MEPLPNIGDVVMHREGGRLMVLCELVPVPIGAPMMAECSWPDEQNQRQALILPVNDLVVVPESDRRGHLRVVRSA